MADCSVLYLEGLPVGIATRPRGKGPAHLGPHSPNPEGSSLKPRLIMGVRPRSPERQSRPRAPKLADVKLLLATSKMTLLPSHKVTKFEKGQSESYSQFFVLAIIDLYETINNGSLKHLLL